MRMFKCKRCKNSVFRTDEDHSLIPKGKKSLCEECITDNVGYKEDFIDRINIHAKHTLVRVGAWDETSNMHEDNYGMMKEALYNAYVHGLRRACKLNKKELDRIRRMW